jgi:hypothetical protein
MPDPGARGKTKVSRKVAAYAFLTAATGLGSRSHLDAVRPGWGARGVVGVGCPQDCGQVVLASLDWVMSSLPVKAAQSEA